MFSAISEPLARFHAAARRLLPGFELNQLRPGGSGIRARSAPAEQTFSDFLIRRDRRQPPLVQAAGVDSPGLTASLAIAERVADLVDERWHSHASTATSTSRGRRRSAGVRF